jgi:hypothetical protein
MNFTPFQTTSSCPIFISQSLLFESQVSTTSPVHLSSSNYDKALAVSGLGTEDAVKVTKRLWKVLVTNEVLAAKLSTSVTGLENAVERAASFGVAGLKSLTLKRAPY